MAKSFATLVSYQEVQKILTIGSLGMHFSSTITGVQPNDSKYENFEGNFVMPIYHKIATIISTSTSKHRRCIQWLQKQWLEKIWKPILEEVNSGIRYPYNRQCYHSHAKSKSLQVQQKFLLKKFFNFLLQTLHRLFRLTLLVMTVYLI